MPRFTISRHTGSKEGDHFDLMLEHGEALKTWRIGSPAFQAKQPAHPIKDHRKTYLDYEGEVSGKRGKVEIWDSGTYAPEVWSEARILVALTGKQFKGRILLEAPADPAADWSLVDASSGLRKAAAAFLRGDPLEAAPTPELDQLRDALSVEERRVMAQIDLFVKGGPVHWAQAALNPELKRRIDADRLRWRHPWLESARTFTTRLGELADQLLQYKPEPGA
jgi:hypothetical protein